jgi:hypothetical protein
MDQWFIDRRKHGFHASELGAPFLAAHGDPITGCRVLVHFADFCLLY